MQQNIPLKLEELKKRREKYIHTLNADKKEVTTIDKLGLWITNYVGSMVFL